ncbi:hypothetical protein B0H17DRAFT_307898 [Mycena rosella]|uniref:Uncharacterized protein n=1 Tax=Mycena rosella TaxID=1033263 RepID=A0AAD7GNK1_MYCRO|nr:hypothetical protein B0H17DRAFT_307898 [Mycena rosella]
MEAFLTQYFVGEGEDPTRLRLQIEARMDDNLQRDGNRIPRGGAKPEDLKSAEGVVLFPIPGSSLSIRAFPGDFHSREGAYFFDVYDMKRRKPVKSRREFRFTLAYSEEPLISVEAAFGISWEDIGEEHEKFALQDGSACCLHRPDAPPFLFQLPSLPKPAPIGPEFGFQQPVAFTL